MTKLISYSSTPYKSIDFKQLSEKTLKENLENFDILRFSLSDVKEVHIIGNRVEQSEDVQFSSDLLGAYYNFDGSSIIILCDSTAKIDIWMKNMPNNVSCLDIRFTEITYIDLTEFNKLRKLNLSYNRKLLQVNGLQYLIDLSDLDLNYTNINELPELDVFQGLHSLNIRNTLIKDLQIHTPQLTMKYLDISNTKVMNLDFITKFSKLKRLSIRGTDVKKLPSINCLEELESLNCTHVDIDKIPSMNKLTKLRSLNLGYTNITTLEDVLLPSSLRTLVLEGTKIKTIPPNVTSLLNLRKLWLNDMELDSLPASILDLELEFNWKNRGMGILFQNTSISDMDISILEQPRLIIEAWFRNRENTFEYKTNPLNESKVIFLGDGGAGKSLSIQRLLNDGEIPTDFEGESTPGISILSRVYSMEARNILIHFWDFGGQEIMHSMHRMFLTKRTLYVVFVNARDNTQDERARYWLHNIKSFAQNAKVLIVINQIDQNPSASVNEPALLELYPNIVKVIKLSATKFSKDEFNNLLQKELLFMLEKMPYINEPFLYTWNLLKHKLQSMKEYYIDSKMFQEMCDNCGVETDKGVRSSLLEWFSDLGISFCYRESSALSNYMILRPDWITNALYIILFNGACRARNGVINHEDIHALLKKTSSRKREV